MNASLPVGQNPTLVQEATHERVMDFVGVSIHTLTRGLFNTIRLGNKWADLKVGEVITLASLEEHRGVPIGTAIAMVAYVDLGEMRDVIRSHSALNFSVRDQRNPESRDHMLGLELRGIYGMGPDLYTKTGTVVYLEPCQVLVDVVAETPDLPVMDGTAGDPNKGQPVSEG
jgi:hypothetical protein